MRRVFASFVLAAIAAASISLDAGPVRAQGIDCAHGPDFYRVRNVASWDRLNIRSGPGTGNPVVGAIPSRGVGVQCLGPCSGRWCRIGWNGIVGWVNMRYLGE